MSMDELSEIVGSANVFRRKDDIARYDYDGRQGGGRAAAVVRPASTAQVSAIMRLAAARQLPLVLQGGRTGLVGAGLADGHIVISLERLSRTPTIDVANRTATVDAGVHLSQLNAAAAEHGLCFPIDLGADPMIGGMVATNTGGARLLRYGDVRRNLLAAEVVLADGNGTVLEAGRALWKDNSGLDLKQLWVGSAGSMGVITRATLALQPLPARRLTAFLTLEKSEAALDLLLALEAQLGSLLTAFEGISREALTATFAHVPNLRKPFADVAPAYAVLVEISAGRGFSETMLEELLSASLEPFLDGAAPPVRDVAIDGGDSLWAIRHSVPEGLRAAGRVVGCDVALPRGKVMQFRADLKARLADTAPQLLVHDFGHIGNGGLHFNLVWPSESGAYDPEIGERARNLVFEAATKEYQGSFSAEHGLGPVNRPHYSRLISQAERDLAGRLQRLVAPVQLGRVDFGADVRHGAARPK